MAPRCRSERGSGLLGAVIGVGVVMAVLGLAANVVLGLWTRTTVDGITYDAARRVASTPAGEDPAARARQATAEARRLLGPYGSRVDLSFESLGPPTVVLHVRAPGVGLLPRMLGGGPVVGAIDRRVAVRREGTPP
jgi:hypothetical protein